MARDLVEAIPTEKISPAYISRIKVQELDGTLSVMDGAEKDRFLKECYDGSARDFVELRLIVDTDTMVDHLMNAVDDVFDRVDRLQDERHK